MEVPWKQNVELTWNYISKDGSHFDLDAPFLEEFIKIRKRESRVGEKLHISTTVTARLDSDSTLFGISVADAVFEYLGGGIIYCMAGIPGNRIEQFASNFLKMPPKNPHHLMPCSHDTVYSIDSHTCVYYGRIQGHHRDLQSHYPYIPGLDFQRNHPDHPEQYPGQDYQGHSSHQDYQGHSSHQDYQGHSSHQDHDEQYSPDGAGVVFEGSSVDTRDFVRSRVKEEKPDKKEDSGYHPWIFALATVGAAIVLVAVIVPLVMVGLYAKKKCKFNCMIVL